MKINDPQKAEEDKDLTFSFYTCIFAFGLMLAAAIAATVYYFIDNYM